jgi:DNA-binding CsgD family transcriptional regulator
MGKPFYIMSNVILPKNHLSLTISKDVADICDILKPYSIEHFGYYRYFYNHSLYGFPLNNGLYNHHLEQGYPVIPQIPKEIDSNKFYYIPGFEKHDKYNQALHDYRSFFNVGNCILFFEKYANYFDLYFFGASQHDYGIINFYLNNIELLEKFKFYFKDKIKNEIAKAEKTKFFVPESMRPSIELCGSGDHDPRRKILLEKMDTKRYTLNYNDTKASITKKELAVLKQLSLGCTLKETAKFLLLSHRTVETYLNNTRRKFKLENKTDIIRILLENNLL